MIDELARELAAAGIPRGLRRRILAEAAEHVRDGSADAFGDPRTLAAQFAEEIGAAAARRAARGSFAALVVVAAAYGAAFLSFRHGQPDVAARPLALLAAVGLLVLPQVALVAGVLAPLARTPRFAVRRAALALSAGAGSLACALLFAAQLDLHERRLWATVPGFAAVAVAGVLILRASRIRTAGGVEPFALTWRQALVVAVAAAVAVGVAGASGGDPGEGVRNLLGESVACMSGFAVFGKAIGVRR